MKIRARIGGVELNGGRRGVECWEWGEKGGWGGVGGGRAGGGRGEGGGGGGGWGDTSPLYKRHTYFPIKSSQVLLSLDLVKKIKLSFCCKRMTLQHWFLYCEDITLLW